MKTNPPTFKTFEQQNFTAGQHRQWFKICIASVLENAAVSKESSVALQRYLLKSLNSTPGVTTIPCYVELASIDGQPVWIIVANWEVTPGKGETESLSHIKVVVIDGNSGRVLAHDSCG